MARTPNMDLERVDEVTATGNDLKNAQAENIGKIDDHDHSLGKGAPIKLSSLDVDEDLSLEGKKATGVDSVTFENRTQPATQARTIYFRNGEPYYKDADNNEQRLVPTSSGGGSNSTRRGILGDYNTTDTAAISYDHSDQEYSFKSSSNNFSDISAKDLVLNEGTDTSKIQASDDDIEVKLPDAPEDDVFSPLRENFPGRYAPLFLRKRQSNVNDGKFDLVAQRMHWSDITGIPSSVLNSGKNFGFKYIRPEESSNATLASRHQIGATPSVTQIPATGMRRAAVAQYIELTPAGFGRDDRFEIPDGALVTISTEVKRRPQDDTSNSFDFNSIADAAQTIDRVNNLGIDTQTYAESQLIVDFPGTSANFVLYFFYQLNNDTFIGPNGIVREINQALRIPHYQSPLNMKGVVDKDITVDRLRLWAVLFDSNQSSALGATRIQNIDFLISWVTEND